MMHRAHKNSFSSQKCPIHSSGPPKICALLAMAGPAPEITTIAPNNYIRRTDLTIVGERSATRKFEWASR